MEFIKWRTGKFIMDIGRMEKLMDLEALNNRIRKYLLGSGKMEDRFNGSMMKLYVKYKMD